MHKVAHTQNKKSKFDAKMDFLAMEKSLLGNEFKPNSSLTKLVRKVKFIPTYIL